MSDNNYNYVIGGGMAGLVFATLNPSFKIIDMNPLGQFQGMYQLGPRILQYSSLLNKFIIDHTPEGSGGPLISEAKVGYILGDGVSTDTMTAGFSEKYSKIAHGSNKGESSFLSGGKNKIRHITFLKHGEESYVWLLKQLLEQIDKENRIKYVKVDFIDTKAKEIALGNGDVYIYDNLVSTIPLPIFQKLVVNKNIELDLETKKKHFYVTNYSEENQKLQELYNYMYSVNGVYTRKTFYGDYIVYETTETHPYYEIDECDIIERYENLPIQIVESYEVEEIDGIHMLGRYAEWNHNVKINEVITRSYKLKGIING